MTRSVRRRFFRALLLVGSTVLALSAAEVALRALSPRPPGWSSTMSSMMIATATGQRYRPNAEHHFQPHSLSNREVLLRTDSNGHRLPGRPSSGPRVLFLGDSVTAQAYLPDPETFVRRIEALAVAGGQQIAAINAGVPSIGLADEVSILHETGDRIEPAVVVLCFYLNDPLPSEVREETTLHGPLRSSRVLGEVLAGVNRILAPWDVPDREWNRWVEAATAAFPPTDGDWKTTRGGFNRYILRRFPGWGMAWSDGAWDWMQPSFERLSQWTSRRRVGLVIACFPVRGQLETTELRDEPQRRLAAVARDLGVPFVDLLPALRESGVSPGELFYDHCHPTARANEIIARGLWEVIEGELKARRTADQR